MNSRKRAEQQPFYVAFKKWLRESQVTLRFLTPISFRFAIGNDWGFVPIRETCIVAFGSLQFPIFAMLIPAQRVHGSNSPAGN